MIKCHTITRTSTGSIVLQIQCDPPAKDGVEHKILSKYDLLNLIADAGKFLAEDEFERILNCHG